MSYKVDRNLLQYEYRWNRDNGDGKYIGALDRNKVDKDEGYEVVEFIENFMAKHGLRSGAQQQLVEKILKSEALTHIVSREELIAAIEKYFRF